jgi:predicted ATPase
LLESAGAYALEQLNEIDDRERFARRHAEYFRRQAEGADDRFGSGSTTAWRSAFELELDNYRAALEWTLTQTKTARSGARSPAH